MAVTAGILGFLLYIGAVVALADVVLRLHWTVQAVYFAVVGIAWVWPVSRLMYWAARKSPPRRRRR
jgi:membrane protein implicated in regulation of membrane protease activity